MSNSPSGFTTRDVSSGTGVLVTKVIRKADPYCISRVSGLSHSP